MKTRYLEHLAKFDRATRSWRTAQCLLFEDSTECLETFPNWGMMRAGECWALSTPEHLIGGLESGLWPTPRAEEHWQGEGATIAYRDAGYKQPSASARRGGDVALADGEGLEEWEGESKDNGEELATTQRAGWWDFEPDVGRVANGVAFTVDRIRALGNGQVPAVAKLAFGA